MWSGTTICKRKWENDGTRIANCLVNLQTKVFVYAKRAIQCCYNLQKIVIRHANFQKESNLYKNRVGFSPTICNNMQKRQFLIRAVSRKYSKTWLYWLIQKYRLERKLPEWKQKKVFQNINLQKIWYLYLQKKYYNTINERRMKMMRWRRLWW